MTLGLEALPALRLPDDRLVLAPGDVVYDPDKDAYQFLPGFTARRISSVLDPPRGATPILFADGRRVLATGGASGTFTASRRVATLDLTSGTAVDAAPMLIPRAGHWGFTLPNGKMLVVGDGGLVVPPKSELYDPAADAWSEVPVPENFIDDDLVDDWIGIGTASATQLSDGDIFATPTMSDWPCRAAYHYDWRANRWSTWPDRPTTPGDLSGGGVAPASAVELNDGRILVTGGRDCAGSDRVVTQSEAWLFDRATEKWSAASPMRHPRTSHASLTLPCGRVLVVGGIATDDVSTSDVLPAEVYDPVRDAWHDVPGSPTALALKPTLVLLKDGSVYVSFGELERPAEGVPIRGRPLFLR